MVASAGRERVQQHHDRSVAPGVGVHEAGGRQPPRAASPYTVDSREPEPRRRPPSLLGLNGKSAGLDVGGRRVTANPWAEDVRVGLQRGGEIGH